MSFILLLPRFNLRVYTALFSGQSGWRYNYNRRIENETIVKVVLSLSSPSPFFTFAMSIYLPLCTAAVFAEKLQAMEKEKGLLLNQIASVRRQAEAAELQVEHF
jgi:hypothetical protein